MLRPIISSIVYWSKSDDSMKQELPSSHVIGEKIMVSILKKTITGHRQKRAGLGPRCRLESEFPRLNEQLWSTKQSPGTIPSAIPNLAPDLLSPKPVTAFEISHKYQEVQSKPEPWKSFFTAFHPNSLR